MSIGRYTQDHTPTEAIDRVKYADAGLGDQESATYYKAAMILLATHAPDVAVFVLDRLDANLIRHAESVTGAITSSPASEGGGRTDA